jgi:DNA mismatch endonuclease (patch repair protein)
MSLVRSKNTRPELLVRSLLHRNGFRFRVNVSKLPGTPDIVLRKYRTVIFINGCLWHGHDCKKGNIPKSNKKYWTNKINRNIDRDRRTYSELKRLSWKVIIVWTCELSSKIKIEATIQKIVRVITNDT